ncbi:hypothetical protein [Streptomyces sp. NPDC087525]|uniref:hypothetical protein n=1 Tax=unclassified Streptomyces TaxID=2593676 RepID=UPI003824E6BC
MIYEVTRVQFKLVSRRKLPRGRACLLREEAGAITVSIRRGKARKRLCSTLNGLHGEILGRRGRWAQDWDEVDGPGRVDQAPKGLHLAHVEWRIVPAAYLPPGVPCLPLEEKGRFVWLICEGYASPQVCEEMNAYLARITGDGLWRQRWGCPGEEPPQPPAEP